MYLLNDMVNGSCVINLVFQECVLSPVFLARPSTQSSPGQICTRDTEDESSPSLQKQDLSAPGGQEHSLRLPTVTEGQERQHVSRAGTGISLSVQQDRIPLGPLTACETALKRPGQQN